MVESLKTSENRIEDSFKIGAMCVAIVICIIEILDGCFKQSMHEHHAKDACCGIYPNRLPFDTLSRECCRESAQDGDNTFSVDTLGLFSNSFLIQFIKSYIISIFHM